MKKFITVFIVLALFASVFTGVSIGVLAQAAGTGYFYNGCEEMTVGAKATGGGSTLGDFFIMTDGTLEVVDNVSGRVFSGTKALKYTTDAEQTWVAPGLSEETTAAIVGNTPGRYMISYYIYAERLKNDATPGAAKMIHGQYRGVANNQYKDFYSNAGGTYVTIGKWVQVVGYFDITAANISSTAKFTLDGTNQSTFYLDDITIKRVDDTAFFDNGKTAFGTYDWSVFSSTDGNISAVIDNAPEHGAVIRFDKSSSPYSSMHYDFGKAIIADAARSYAGSGAGRYRIAFDAKIASTDNGGNDISNRTYEADVLLQSQAHNDAVPVPGAGDYALSTYFFPEGNASISIGTSWQRFSSDFVVSEAFLNMLAGIRNGEITSNASGINISGKDSAYQLGIRLDGSKDADLKDVAFAYYIDNITIEFLGNDTAVYLESAGTRNYYGGPFWSGRLHESAGEGQVSVQLYNPNNYTVYYDFQLRAPADGSWDPTVLSQQGEIGAFSAATVTLNTAPAYYVTNDKKAYTSPSAVPSGQSYTKVAWDEYFYLIYLAANPERTAALPNGDSMLLSGLPETFSHEVTISDFNGLTQNSAILSSAMRANGTVFSADEQICAVTTNFDGYPGGIGALGTGVRVTAKAEMKNDANTFVGWYDGDTFLSGNAEYSFYTYENFEIEARYAFKRVGLEFTVQTQNPFIGGAGNTRLKGLPIQENGNVELILTNHNAYGVYAHLDGRVLSDGAWPRVSQGVKIVYIPAHGTGTLTLTNVPSSFTDNGTVFSSADYFYLIYICTDASVTNGVAKTDANNRFTLEYLEENYAEALLGTNAMPGVAANRNIAQYYSGNIDISQQGSGGSITPVDTRYIKDGQTVALQAFLEENGVFEGWFVNGVFAGDALNYTFVADADITISAHFKNTSTITVNTGNSSLTYTINGGEAIVYTGEFSVFKEDVIIFTATAAENSRILGFRRSGETELLLSQVPEAVAITATGENISLEVCVAEAAQAPGMANVYFVDNTGHLLHTYQNTAQVTQYPASPTREGYAFAGWSLALAEINAQISSGSQMVVVEASYNKIQKQVSVRLAEDIAAGTVLVGAVPTGYYETLTLLTAQAPAESGDLVFGYWYNDATGEILSYQANYTFYALKSVVLNARYVTEQEAAVLEISQKIKMAQISRNKDGSLTFMAEREFSADTELLSFGILIKSSQEDTVAADDLVATGQGVLQANAAQLNRSGIYTVTKRTGGQLYWYARAYAVYKKDGQTATVYSAMVKLRPNLLPTNAESFENVNDIPQTEIGNQSNANLSVIEGGVYQNTTNVLKLQVTSGNASPFINLREYIHEPGTYSFAFDYCLEFTSGGYIPAGNLLFRTVMQGTNQEATSIIIPHPDGSYYGVIRENKLPNNEMWWYTLRSSFTVTQEDLDGASSNWNICIDSIDTVNIAAIYFDNFQLLKTYENTQIVTGAASDFEGVSTPQEASWESFGTCSVEIAPNGYNSTQAIKSYGYPNNNTYSSQSIDLYPYMKESGREGYYTVRFMAKVESKTGENALSNGENAFSVVIRGQENSFITSSGYYSVPVSFQYENDSQWKEVSFELFVTQEDFATGGNWRFCLHLLAANLSSRDIKVEAIYIDDFTVQYTGLHTEEEAQRFIPQKAKTWVAEEIVLVSAEAAESFLDKEINLTLTHEDGTTLTIPGFWDGGKIYRIRYALPKAGVWNYAVTCSDVFDTMLQVEGTVLCTAYTGNLDIYKHGFLKTVKGTRYFMYNDGTPFFYLGDTHWALGQEAKDEEATFTGYTADASGTFASGIRYTGNQADSVTVSFAEKLAQTRVKQGFTVIQSEPLGAAFALENGITDADIAGLRQFDATFKAIADAGLVHANAEFFFPSQMSVMIDAFGGVDKSKILCYSDDMGNVISEGEYNQNPEQAVHVDGTNHIIYDYQDSVYEYMDKLTRYWVARYGAYPVMWTLGQEVDNDFYYNRENNSGHVVWNSINNPYLLVAAFIEKYDAYQHPLSAHQESIGTAGTECLGNGMGYYLAGTNLDQNGNIVKFSQKRLTPIDTQGSTLYYGDSQTRPSAFRNVSNHTWYAAQLSSALNTSGAAQMNTIAKDYWYNGQGKVVVNYEPRYCYLWTKNYGMRVRGWSAYLSGMFGYAYGAQDTWDYLATYNENVGSADTVEYIAPEEKQAATYIDGLNFKSADQLGYARNFFENTVGDWQNLIPRFDDSAYFAKSNSGVMYYMASNSDNSKIVLYFYTVSVTENSNLAQNIVQMHNGGYDMPDTANGSALAASLTGTVKNLAGGATYSCTWFNPRTGQAASTFTKNAGLLGNMVLNTKPDGCDWVLYIEKV